MKKQFDEFQKMKMKDVCKTIEDMTYSYINPETKKPTVVPSKHYENILNKTVEQFLDDTLKIEMLSIILKQIISLEKENTIPFIKALICMDKGIKPTDLSIAESFSLDLTANMINETKIKEKKKFHYLDQEYLNRFDEFLNDKDLHRQLIQENSLEFEDDEELEDDDFGLMN